MSTEQRPGASGSHAGLDPEGDVVLIFYAGCSALSLGAQGFKLASQRPCLPVWHP